MGIIQNDIIIVTGYGKDIQTAHDKASDIFNVPFLDYGSNSLVTPIVKHIINDDSTFMIVPDGSKEGWDLSDEFDNRRKEYIQWLKKNPSGIDWVHVTYGEIQYRIADSDDWHGTD